MKRIFVYLAVLVLTATASAQVLGQEEKVDRLNVKFSDPTRPGVVEVGLHYGGVNVTGYDGDEVVIEARTQSKKLDESSWEGESRGMKRIPVSSTSLTVEEDDNYIEIDTESHKRPVDITLKVPVNTSLILSCHHQGDIHVENVKGIIEAENHHGGITLLNISGAVRAETHHQDVIVTFRQVEPQESMSFETYHGDIDVTFPSTVRANVKFDSKDGDVYSDFDVVQAPNPEHIIEENGRSHGGKYRVEIEHAFYGTLNGGGPEMAFTTYHGNIYIRKAE